MPPAVTSYNGVSGTLSFDGVTPVIRYLDWGSNRMQAARLGNNFMLSKQNPQTTDVACPADVNAGVTLVNLSGCSSWVANSIQLLDNNLRPITFRVSGGSRPGYRAVSLRSPQDVNRPGSVSAGDRHPDSRFQHRFRYVAVGLLLRWNLRSGTRTIWLLQRPGRGVYAGGKLQQHYSAGEQFSRVRDPGRDRPGYECHYASDHYECGRRRRKTRFKANSSNGCTRRADRDRITSTPI